MGFLRFLGWIIVIGGALFIGLSFSAFASGYGPPPAIYGVIAVIVGLIIVFFSRPKYPR